MVMTSPDCTFSFKILSIILPPRSYTVSISVVFRMSLPTFVPTPVAGLSIWTSTTSPSIISLSSLKKKAFYDDGENVSMRLT
jgi:hypothetical protein